MASKKNEEVLKEKARKISIREASAWSFMDGFGLRYLTPYALVIGANNFSIGLLSSIPSLLGNLPQLITSRAMRSFSRKKIVFLSVFLQAIMWLFIIGAGILYFLYENKTGQMPAYVLIAVYTLLIFFGAFGGPAWTSWMGDIVKENRGEYFGRRSRIAGTVSLICMIIAGFILDYFKHTQVFVGFIILFSVAFLARLVSALLILKQYEPKYTEKRDSYFTIVQFMKRMLFNNFGRFVLYYSLICLTTAIASPFYSVFMLTTLGFSYSFYTIVILGSSLSSLLFVSLWGRFADRYGNLRTMQITGLLTPILPLMWAVVGLIMPANIFFYIIFIEIFSGILWSGFNLAAGNFIYDAVSRERVAICSSYFSILSGFGVVIGAFLGGIIANMHFNIFGIGPLLFVFLLSGLARLLVYNLFKKGVREVRNVEPFEEKKFLAHVGNKLKNRSLLKFFEVLRNPASLVKTRFEQI